MSSLTRTVEPGKTEVAKRIRAASAIGALCTSREALRRGIDTLRARLDTYDLEMWSILHERETCVASVKELEEVLAAESTDEEAEMRDEKSHYDAKRAVTARQEVVEEDKDGDEGESEEEEDEEEDEDEDEPVRSSGLSAKAQGKRPAK